MSTKPTPGAVTDADDNAEAVAAFNKLSSQEKASFLASVERGVADGLAGRTVSAEAVRRWIASWDTEGELPSPK